MYVRVIMYVYGEAYLVLIVLTTPSSILPFLYDLSLTHDIIFPIFGLRINYSNLTGCRKHKHKLMAIVPEEIVRDREYLNSQLISSFYIVNISDAHILNMPAD